MKNHGGRYYMRAKSVPKSDLTSALNFLKHANLSEQHAEEIYKLTSLCTVEERYVFPPVQREEAIDGLDTTTPEQCKGSCGFGENHSPKRGV
jgi:nitrate reductase beta subunit